MNMHAIFGVASVITALVGYIPYIIDIFKGTTKPHAFSWFIWFSAAAISFAGQLSDNAGAGSWVMGTVTFVCFGIFLLSLRKGEKHIVLIDYICLGISIIAIVSWVLTNTPLYAVILITLGDIFGFIPTIRKSISKPYEETMFMYVMSSLQFIFSLFALENISIITTLNPFVLSFINLGFVFILIARRRVIGANIV